MNLAGKAAPLLALAPDIVVAQEAAAIPKLGDLELIHWVGKRANKGLGVWARPEYGGALHSDFDETRQWWIPIAFRKLDLHLLTSWAMGHRGEEPRPRADRSLSAVQHYEPFLSHDRSILLGDLNNNEKWDNKRNPSFKGFTNFLAGAGLQNVYYTWTQETPGLESSPTLFMYRHADKPHMVDHVFASAAVLRAVEGLEIGKSADWLQISDHTPVIVDLGL
jgi:hypothetical protein